MPDPRRIEQIRRTIEEGPPHIGSETEGILTDAITLDVVHRLAGKQPAQAVRAWIMEQGKSGELAVQSITPDIPETTIEANPLPLRSPRSTAASQRLLAILIDTAIQRLSPDDRPAPCLLHGAAWRPPHLTTGDASEAADTFKRLYYQFQIEMHGDKVGAAAGDHLNISAPWWGEPGDAEISRKMIEMAGRMRLVG